MNNKEYKKYITQMNRINWRLMCMGVKPTPKCENCGAELEEGKVKGDWCNTCN